MSSTPQSFLREGGDVYESKNDDYGDSWRKVGQILYLLADGETVELETPQDHVSYGLFTRRLDKFARAYHGEFLGDEPNHEPIVDAHTDEMVYAAMSASNLQSPPKWSQTRKSTSWLSKLSSVLNKTAASFRDSLTFHPGKESTQPAEDSSQ